MTPQVTRNLLIINTIVFLFMAVSASLNAKLFSYGGLHYFAASRFNVVQMLSYMFIHGSFTHLLFNMFTLFMFGGIIERVLGSGRFLFYYLSCGLGAAIIQELSWFWTIDSILGSMYNVPAHDVRELILTGRLADLPLALNSLVTVGASGAIYGILLAFAMLFPNMRMSVYFLPIFVKAKWMVLAFCVIELLIGMSNAHDGIAHFAHLGGMLFGLVLIFYWKKKHIINGPYY